MNDVIIVGSGPTGLMLGAELALAGVDVAILERRRTSELAGSRAGGFHARTLEILDQRGIADRFLAEGQTVQVAGFGTTMVDVSDLPTRHPYSLGLFQNHIERILLGWVEELGVPIRRGVEVTGLAQDDAGVEVQVAEGPPLRAAYLVGADGGRSVVRRAAGIDFVGPDATRSHLIAEVEVTEEPPAGIRRDATGVHGLGLMEDGRTTRVVVTEHELVTEGEPTLAELGEALRFVFGTDFGVHNPTWISRFTDAARQAAAYRVGRVLLAGDAAHTHHPAGGQGIGLGVQDAVNLGWKLAQVVQGVSDRRPPGHLPRGAAPGGRPDAGLHDGAVAPAEARRPHRCALRDPRRHAGLRRAAASGRRSHLRARRHLRPRRGAPAAGPPDARPRPRHAGRAPPGLRAAPRRPAAAARPRCPAASTPRVGDRVRHVEATYDGAWELPVIGAVTAPTAVLVRPDGHVAWVGGGRVGRAR